MFKRTKCLLSVAGMSLTLFMSFLPSHIVATTSAEQMTSAESAAELLQLSGMQEQLQSLPDAVIDSFEQSIRSGGLDLPFLEEDIPYLKSSLLSVFNSERLQLAVQTQLQTEMNEQQSASLIRFYQSSRGREIQQAEIANSILRHRQRFTLWHEELGLRSLSDTRQQAIRELERALHATDAAVDTLISMQVALQVGLSPALPSEQRQSVAQLISSARAHRPALTRAYEESSLESLAFVYQLQSLQTLRAFAAILKTPAGQRYVHAVNRGLSKGMLDAAEALGESMKPLLVRRLGQGV